MTIVEVVELALMAIGFLAVGTLYLDLFTSVGYQGRLLTSAKKVPAVKSQEFLETLAHTIDRSVQPGGPAEILTTGAEFIEALLKDIAQAQRSITIMVYIWRPGWAAQTLLAALKKKAKEGVAVRVLLDGQGTSSGLGKEFAALRQLGGKVTYFRPLRFGKILRWHRRTHRRALVIDGRVAYTGGMAFADSWFKERPEGDYWRDLMVRTTGTMAHSIQAAFAQLWVSATGEILTGEEYYAPVEREKETSPFVSVASSPSFDSAPLDKIWWLTFRAARESLDIASPFFILYPSLIQALEEQARAGVRIRLLLPGPRFRSHLARWASHIHYATLLQAGVRIYEYQAAMLHSKLIVADGAWSVVGSANLDPRSVRLNEENVLGILDEDLAGKLTAVLEEDIKNSREIIDSKWRLRGVLAKARENFFRLFREQF
jgi:cardiolipin synthase